jgi:hypothetical protein
MLDIVAGRDAVLELTADNAEVEPAASATTTPSARAPEADSTSTLLMQWQESVVALWTPIAHASGFVIDANGLIATSQRAIGAATSVEVQLTPQIKVAGSVLVSDAARDVAIVRVNPSAVASMRSAPLGCGLPAKPLDAGQTIFAFEVPLRDPRDITRGRVIRAEPHAIVADLIFAEGSAGGPVFDADGGLVGLTSAEENDTERRHGDVRVVPSHEACDIVTAAERKANETPPPSGAHLPVEPARAVPVDELRSAAQRRQGSLNPYQMSSQDFDIAFITPVMVYGEQYRLERTGGGTTRIQGQAPGTPAVRPLEDFSNWSTYVDDVPPVLLVRVTPKQVEGFWTTVARGAAQTQGVALPPIKHFKSGFLRLRALCGDADVTPIHPFKLEHRVSETDAIYEGLYVFDPSALGPACGTVTLVTYSEKAPEKGDTRAVDARLLQQIWRDLAMLQR